jgi:anthranilate synthase component 2
MLTMIDNYDSFTFNLVQYFGELGADVTVHRNDAISVAEVRESDSDHVVISPGPCTPTAFGGRIVRAGQVMHGKTSPVYHTNSGVFSGLSNPFTATRYHSLVVERESLPDCFEITAWTQTPDGDIDEIMGLRHRELAIEGVQFHPESIMTEHGHDMLQNWSVPCDRLCRVDVVMHR